MDIKVVARNKKAFHDYHILDRFEAGIELVGSEVKSLREGKANLKESYVIVKDGEAHLMSMHIGTYSHTGYSGHEILIFKIIYIPWCIGVIRIVSAGVRFTSPALCFY